MARVSQWDLGDEKTAKLIGQLWNAFTMLEDRVEVRQFLSKFFTPTEIQMFAKRLELLKLADSDLEVMQLVRWLGIAKVTVYEWLEKHDAYEQDFHLIVDRLKDSDQKYLERIKEMTKVRVSRQYYMGADPLKPPANAYKGYKKRQKRKSVLASQN